MRLTIKNLHKLIGVRVPTRPDLHIRVADIMITTDAYRFVFTTPISLQAVWDIWLWREGNLEMGDWFYHFETIGRPNDNMTVVTRAIDLSDMGDVGRVLGKMLVEKYDNFKNVTIV